MDCFVGQLCSTSSRSDHHSAGKAAKKRLCEFWTLKDPTWYDFAQRLLCADWVHPLEVWTSKLDVLSFAAGFGICTTSVLKHVEELASASDIPEQFINIDLPADAGVRTSSLFQDALNDLGSKRGERDCTLRNAHVRLPRLPKRLFRSIGSFDYIGAAPRAQDEEDNEPRKQRRKLDVAFPTWLSQLLTNLAHVPSRTTHCKEVGRVPPQRNRVPPAEDLEMIFMLLYRYCADASSDQGYGLAMAVHNQAYSLVHLLLIFGADPNLKEGLAGKIAIQNGFLDILHRLVTGPSFDIDAPDNVPFEWSGSSQEGSNSFVLTQEHLKLAIKSKKWDTVDYIWHERNVPPNMECLRLIDRLRH